MSNQHGGCCFICLSPYWHRNLHDDRTIDKLKMMSTYEMDMLPQLWRNVLYKNSRFCEHVCHSWLRRSMEPMVSKSNGSEAELSDHDMVQKEALRLREMLDGLIEGIKKRKAQIIDSKEHLLVFARRSGGRKQRVPWLPITRKNIKTQKIQGKWFELAESLTEQYSVNLDMEDVHEREMRVIIWKHFIFSLLQHLIECSSSAVLA